MQIFCSRTGDSTRVALRLNPTTPMGYNVAIQGAGMFMSTLEQMGESAQSPSDILFVLDRSGSMQDDLDILAANFDTFINELSSHATDWQVMVVTEDDGCSNSQAS